MQLRLTSQGMVLLYEGMSYFPGQQLVLKRHQVDEGVENGLRLQEGLNLYTGDLHVSISNGALLVVLTVPIEEYLLGVVPYEMSDMFPLEALKAQAIAARTYTLRNLRPSEAYDMTDTTNDQVYYGLNPEKANAIRAVKETEGIACFYQNKLAQCYYTASNGGITESALNAWGRENIPYLGVVEDRYDRANPQSEMREARLPARVRDQSKDLNPVLLRLLLTGLRGRMETLGYSGETADIRIDGIKNILPHTTKYGGETGVMRFLRFDLKVSGKRLETQDEEVSFQVAGTAPLPTETASLQLSAFQAVPRIISVDCAIFPDIEQALGLSINRSDNELVHVIKAEDGFIIRFTRYGHGVGLSQRGAEWMAGTHGWDDEKILRFYYPGTELKKVDTSFELPPALGSVYLATPGPVPTATPKPTLMPVDTSAVDGASIVRVTNIPVNSSLNLRAQASLNSEVLMRLYFGQKLIVMERSEDGWLLVKTDVAQGYVREEYVSFD
ncbi:MAG: SpoIID/LytB domain-containing protein [Christensenellales bacterium]